MVLPRRRDALVLILFFSSPVHAQESHEAVENVGCELPEMVDAASTGSIPLTSGSLVQSFDACFGDADAKYRTADGSCNNVFNYGSAFRPPRRLLPNAYDDGVNAPRTRDSRGSALPAATNVSRTVHTRNDVNENFTLLMMQWGQFMDHDLTGFPISSEVNHSIRCCGPNGEILNTTLDGECFPILLTPEDSDVRFVGRCMEFARSVAARGILGYNLIPREQVNSVTSFIDASMVYGSTQHLQEELRERTVSGNPGFLMKTSVGDLLPRNPEENCVHRPNEFCFLAGDTRVNEQPLLATLHTMFVRLHNFIARELKLVRDQDTDEEIFQEARKILIAIVQNIHYGEWLPLVIGRSAAREFGLLTGSRTCYVPVVDPRITNAFSTAAFRFGHSLIPNEIVIDGSARPLRELFNRPDKVFDNLDSLLKALISPLRSQGSHTLDRFITEEVTGHLFEPIGQPGRGLDLAALNIQRGRDHGIPPYNRYRLFCGLPAFTSFDDLPAALANVFRQVYRSVEDIDLFSGLLSEERAGTVQLVGPTLTCLLGNQFYALKYGDRFYFETDSEREGFTDEQLSAIRNVTMAHVCCRSGSLQRVQKNAFQIPSGRKNPLVDCSDLRQNFLNFTLWQN